jgi:hypothetical protein
LLDAAGKVLGAIWDGIWTALKTAIRVAWDAIIGIIKFELGLPGQLMKAAFDGLVKIVTGMPGAIAGAAKGMFDGISTAFKAAVNFIINGWNGIKFGIPGFDVGPIHYGGFSLGVPHIPTLHTGGVVPGLPGTEVRANLLAGERVLSRSDIANGHGGGGDTHIHLHMNLAMLPSRQQVRDFCDAIEPELGRRLGRTSTSVGYGLGGS